ncbi:MAG TPA: PASTA domain-containing protein [Acidimicrobiales bacterium]|nr:PASTA domain-containing protein [Acidimicrobiales bacterium]
MAKSRMADHVGRVLGDRYRLLAPIGTGASAQVFLAEDVTLRRQVAVKILHAALAEDESFLRRFRAEAQQAAALNHPNIMRVFDWGESDDGPYLVLEYLGGGSLRDVLDAGPLLSASQALLVGLEAARALDYAHRRHLVHRDIKPANLLFDDEGRLCIADFGLARALAEAAWTEPAGAILGTARYASPEQAQGKSVDGKADVYALALVLVEAVTGQVPFSADTTIATLMARVGASLDVPPELGPLGPVLQKAAAPDPEQRLDARRLATSLDKTATDLPVPAPLQLVRTDRIAAEAAGALEEGGDGGGENDGTHATVTLDLRENDITHLGVRRLYDGAEDAADAAPHPGLLPAASRRRRRWPWIAAVAVFLLLLGAGTAYVLARSRVPSHPVPALRGQTVPQAKAALRDEDFSVKVSGQRFDEELVAGAIIDQNPSSLATLREGSTVTVVVSKGPAPRPVPLLLDLDRPTAEKTLTDAGFVPKVVTQINEEKPKGVVVDWSPKGATLPKGSDVTVIISDGPAPIEVPDLSGKTYEDAKAVLTGKGLEVAQLEKFDSDVDKGQVISTTPGTGAKVPKGETVTIIVSKGPDIVDVPEVAGKTVAEATAILRAAGLGVSGTGGKPNGDRVIFTDPQAGTKARRGTGVFLYVR